MGPRYHELEVFFEQESEFLFVRRWVVKKRARGLTKGWVM